jgi:RNA polymerase sigma-70 factor (ECF subfamily)
MISDRHLFWKLTEPEHLQARAFCRRLMGNREDGDDLYQDALVTAFTRFDSLRDREAFRGWLFRIIVNGFSNRKRSPWYKRFGPLTAKIAESTPGENPVGTGSARRKLEIAFGAVSAEEKAIVTLFELDGWTIAEIALMEEKSEGAIKMKLSRARRKMREALAKHLQKSEATAGSKTKLSEDKICVAAKPSRD